MTFSHRHRERLTHQIALAICVGMSTRQMSEAMGIPLRDVALLRTALMDRTGMADRIEFALQQNAAVRELLHPS